MKVTKRRSLKQASKPVRARKRAEKRIDLPIRKRRGITHITQQPDEELQSLQSMPSSSKESSPTSRGEKEYHNETHRDTHVIRQVLSSIKPTIDNARIDHVNAEFLFSVIACHIDDYEQLKVYTGGQPKYSRKEELEPYSKFCNVPKRFNKTFYTKIRKRNLWLNQKEYDSPLVSGRLTFPKIHIQAPYTAFQACYNLNINPTRAINVTEGFSELTERDRRNRILGKTQTLLDHTPIRSLDNNDNLCSLSITDSQYKEDEKNYLYSLIDGLEDELHRACELPSIELTTPSFESISFNEVETYWDIELDNAPSFLEKITPYLKCYGKSVQERTHGVDDITKKNQKSLTIYINDQERITIYAKATNRIRFEVKSIFRESTPSWLKGGKKRKTKASALRLIQQVKVKSVKSMSELIGYLLQVSDKPEPRIIASSPEFVRKWTTLFIHDQIAEELLDLLVANGRLVTGQSLDSIGQAVDRILKRARRHGLLIRKGKTLHPVLPCKKIYTSKLTSSQKRIIKVLATETQTVSGENNNPLDTRVSSDWRRIPPPPPIL
ncbi:MAG: hypothetical protein ACJAR1_002159 [Rubritalea sp.]|jgi:hypothetical protein